MHIKVILLATDGSPTAIRALDAACELARTQQARLIVLHVQRRHGAEVMPEGLKGLERLEHIRVTEADLLRQAAGRIVEAAQQAARERGVADVEGLIVEGDATRAIVETAGARGADLIVIGSRGIGDLQGLLLGSVSHKVVNTAPCSCLIVR